MDHDRLLKIYQDADAVLHSRIQSYLFSQTFLIVAFSTVVSSATFGFSRLLISEVLCLLGVFLSETLREKMCSVNNKMRDFRPNLAEVPEYALYFGARIGERNTRSNEFVHLMPRLISLTWVLFVVLAIWVYFSNSN